MTTRAEPDWKRLLDHVMAVPEGIYEHWNATEGWDNHTQWGVEYGEDGVPYCVIGAWDMFHECGMDKAVPKVDNVVVFSNWAHANGEWSEYPSIGAYTNFGNSHCEIVIGFTATDVITKGWNSIKAGSADSGQGNGVWVHTNPRTALRVIGYMAPRFSDGQCPPTADPRDPRGGQEVTSYTWPGPDTPTAPAPAPAPAPRPTPGPTVHPRFPYPVGIHPGGNSPSAKPLQEALKRTQWMDESVPESDHYGPLTQQGVAGFNRKHGFNDAGVDWDPAIGPHGWALLMTLAYGTG